MNNKLVIIDGNSLINRSYYAIQRPMITKEGLYTQGVYGFLSILTKIVRDHEPGYIAVAFDLKAPTFRHEEYEGYKAGREKMPPELAMQIPILKDILDAMNIKRMEIEGFEADDIIGTIVKKAEEYGLEPYVVTGDKDELQLASDITKIIITRKGISDFDIYDRTAMIEEYGFTPDQFIDFKGLMGDQSDNIPGIPGVGDKTARKLIEEYGSVENLLANVDSMPQNKLKERIESNAQLAMISKRLATIMTEVPLDIDFNEFLSEPPDMDRLIDIYSKLEFNSYLRKLREGSHIPLPPSFKAESANSRNISGYASSVKTEHGQHNQSEVLKSSHCLKVFHDNNHKAKPEIYGIALQKDDDSRYFSWEHDTDKKSFLEIWENEVTSVCGHDLKYDYYALMFESIQVKPIVFDTAIAEYLLDSGRRSYDLPGIVLQRFHEEFPSEKEIMESFGQIELLNTAADQGFASYGQKWCSTVFRLAGVLLEQIHEKDLFKVMSEIELPLIEILASLEKEGISVDTQMLLETGKLLNEKIDSLTKDIYEHAGEEFNINSPKQLGVILFEKMGLPTGKKTKTGYSTGAEILDKIRGEDPIIPLILEFRMYSKLNSTYIEGMLPLIDKKGKIHAHFQQTVTATGRLSCTEPNLQNIPIRQDFGRLLRKAFITESNDYILIGADYSQIELRLLAHMSGEPLLIESFIRGDDIHKITAARVFKVPEDNVTGRQRSEAKVVNFGIIYGMSGFGLASELNISRREAEKYIEEYFKTHPKVKAYMNDIVEYCKEKGYVTTITGRRRYIKEISASNKITRQLGERLAMNSPLQGSAADIIKIAMIKTYDELKKVSPRSRIVLQIHDELIIQAPKDEEEKVKKTLVAAMENAVQLNVPLVVDVNTGTSWYELK